MIYHLIPLHRDGSPLVTAHPSTYHAFPYLIPTGFRLLEIHLGKTRPKDFKCRHLVLKLGSLILDPDHQAGGFVPQLDGRVCLVPMLTTGTRSPTKVPFKIPFLGSTAGVRRHFEAGNRNGTRMNPIPPLSWRNPLPSVPPAFVVCEPRIGNAYLEYGNPRPDINNFRFKDTSVGNT